MRVIVGKFYSESKIVPVVRKILDKETRQTGNHIKIFSISEGIQKKLESAGIKSDILFDFQSQTGGYDHTSWETVYQLSDEIYSSSKNNEQLKYSGISIINLEFDIIRYIYAVKFAKLCQTLAHQNLQVVVIVLIEPFCSWFPDISSRTIKICKYRENSITKSVMKPFRSILSEGYLFLAYLTRGLKSWHSRERGETPGQNNILFVVSTLLYAKPAAAIYNRCLESNLNPFIVTDDLSVPTFLQKHDIRFSAKPPLSIFFLTPFSLWRSVFLFPWRLKKYVSSSYDNNKHREIKSEISILRLCMRTLRNELRRLSIKSISDIDYLQKEILRKTPALVCLMPQSGWAQQLAAALAKEFGIPSLACGAAWETDEAPSFLRHVHTDKVATMGEKAKEIYIASGVNSDRITATGIAHLDQLFNRNAEQDDHVLSGYGISPKHRIIVFATQPSAITEIEPMTHEVIKAVLEMNDAQLVIKTHPAEDIKPYQLIAGQYETSRIHVIRDIDLYALLNRCSLVIVKFSNVALEAMMIDKPVVTVNLENKSVPVPYAEEGAAIEATQLEDIRPAILSALFDKGTLEKLRLGRERFLRGWACGQDDNASKRIVDLMKQMIDESNQAGRSGETSKVTQ